MMKTLKNKSSVVALLIVAVVVWGIILCRLIVFSGNREVTIAIKRNNRPEIRERIDSLILNYRDPFLGISSPQKVTPVSRIFQKETIPKQPEAIPSFRYAGKIKKGNRDFLLITSREETRLISTCEKTIEGFRLEKIYTDSLRVCKGRKQYTIRME